MRAGKRHLEVEGECIRGHVHEEGRGYTRTDARQAFNTLYGYIHSSPSLSINTLLAFAGNIQTGKAPSHVMSSVSVLYTMYCTHHHVQHHRPPAPREPGRIGDQMLRR